MGALAEVLSQGSVDLVILDHVAVRPDVEHVALGFEELVLVESRRHRMRDDVYLDHDPEDTTTLTFLGRNGVKTRFVRRSFFDDIYGVLDAAMEGFGRAVVPKHLLVGPAADALRIVPDMRPSRTPVVMHYFRQPSYTRAHEAVREAIAREVPSLLVEVPAKRGLLEAGAPTSGVRSATSRAHYIRPTGEISRSASRREISRAHRRGTMT
jgi:hypothetical protein